MTSCCNCPPEVELKRREAVVVVYRSPDLKRTDAGEIGICHAESGLLARAGPRMVGGLAGVHPDI